MTRNEILKSDRAKELFIRDSGIPMPVYESPYFQMRLSELEELLGSVKSFLWFCDVMEPMRGTLEYDYHRNKLSRKLRDEFSGFFRSLIEMDFSDLKSSDSDLFTFDTGGLYHRQNDGQMFLRIGLVNKNISLIHYVLPECPDNIDKMIPGGLPVFLKNSDAFMADVFHSVRFRLSQLTHIMLSNILTDLMDIKSLNLVGIEDNALIFKSVNDVFYMDSIDRILSKYKGLFFWEAFTLHEVKGYGEHGSSGWMEELVAGGVGKRFVNIDPNLLHILAIYNAHDYVFKDDLIVNCGGRLAKLLDVPENPFT